MRKVLLGICIIAFFVIGVADQSWAMGKRRSRGQDGQQHRGGHSGGQSGNFDDGDFDDHNGASFVHNQNNNENSNDNNGGNENDQNVENFRLTDLDQGTQPNNSIDEQFPAATVVPEPATLALMGMGLAGIFLKRKKI